MLINHDNPSVLKRLSIWVMVLFVASWINMGIQGPAHAAMQQAMQMQQMDDMMDMDMQECYCPPSLCEAVLAMDNQSMDGQFSNASVDQLVFLPVFIYALGDSHRLQAAIRLNYADWQYRQTSPPPLSFTNILLI